MIRMCSWGSVLPSSLASTGPLTVSTLLIVPLLRCLPLSTPGTAGARLSPRRPSVGAGTALAVPDARQLADRLPRYAEGGSPTCRTADSTGVRRAASRAQWSDLLPVAALHEATDAGVPGLHGEDAACAT